MGTFFFHHKDSIDGIMFSQRKKKTVFFFSYERGGAIWIVYVFFRCLLMNQVFSCDVAVDRIYSAAASSAGASAADSVAVPPSSFFFLPKASAPKADFSFSSPRSNFWSGFVVALSPERKAAALAESESPEDFLILAAVLFTRFN